MRRESEIGGLLTLEAMSLLTTVFAKVESVLLARTLNNYNQKRQVRWVGSSSVSRKAARCCSLGM